MAYDDSGIFDGASLPLFPLRKCIQLKIMTINRMVLAIILDDQEEILYLKAHWPSMTGKLRIASGFYDKS